MRNWSKRRTRTTRTTAAGRPGDERKPKQQKRYGAGLPGFPELWNEEGAEVTLRIDSKLLAAAESEDPKATRKNAAEELRRIVSTVGSPGEPGERIRCVVSVNMLSEGWDANNVTHVLGLRAFHSQLLCEQVVGRGLRRMDYVADPETGHLTAEYVDVFGVPFSLIPFKGRQPKGPAPPEDRPKHEVMALPERKALEIRFPVVEGYVASLRRHLISCDLGNVERTSLDPWDTPTAVFVRPQVGYQIGHPGVFAGFGFEEADRQGYYDSVHPQTIEFAIAGEITRELTEAAGNGRPPCEGRQTLFPQVLRIVQEYIRERVDLNGLHPCDVGLQTYAKRIVGLLTAAITPDESRGEPPLLPRLNRYRRVGSTGSVHFKTVKPVQATEASHLNYVACDTESWEQAAVFQLEKLAKEGLVRSYARNDRLEFNITSLRALRQSARLRARLHRATDEWGQCGGRSQGEARPRRRCQEPGREALDICGESLGAARGVGLSPLPESAIARQGACGPDRRAKNPQPKSGRAYPCPG